MISFYITVGLIAFLLFACFVMPVIDEWKRQDFNKQMKQKYGKK